MTDWGSVGDCDNAIPSFGLTNGSRFSLLWLISRILAAVSPQSSANIDGIWFGSFISLRGRVRCHRAVEFPIYRNATQYPTSSNAGQMRNQMPPPMTLPSMRPKMMIMPPIILRMTINMRAIPTAPATVAAVLPTSFARDCCVGVGAGGRLSSGPVMMATPAR